MSYLIDTNVVSELARVSPEKNVLAWFETIPDDSLYISVLTLGEIRKGVEKVLDSTRREKLLTWLEHHLPDWFEGRILPIDKLVADCWGRLQVEMQRSIPAIDSLLAATALHYDLRLVTRNEKDFQIPMLNVINPWKL